MRNRDKAYFRTPQSGKPPISLMNGGNQAAIGPQVSNGNRVQS